MGRRAARGDRLSLPLPGIIGALLGAVLGSFIATLVIRWPATGTALRGRSRCDGCGATLPPGALFPLLSFVVQRGRARCCNQAIDGIHPAAELCAAGIGGASFLLFGWDGWVGALLGWMLLTLALFDLRHFVLPDWLNGALAVSGLAVAIWVPFPMIGDRLIGAVAGYGILAAIGWGYHRLRGREGLGGGDPKLLGAIGAWIGWQMLPMIMLAAAALGLAAALVMRASGRAVTATTRMPLGTLMAAVAWPVWLWMQAGPGFPAR